jgi:predicted nuclease of restriction endonuclease-like (RecB) superfamily
LEHLREFLLEPGVGFAFVASQYRFEVAGKMNFYLSAVTTCCAIPTTSPASA